MRVNHTNAKGNINGTLLLSELIANFAKDSSAVYVNFAFSRNTAAGMGAIGVPGDVN